MHTVDVSASKREKKGNNISILSPLPGPALPKTHVNIIPFCFSSD